MTLPDGTSHKEYFATSGWQRGLTIRTETWAGGVKKKWATFSWEHSGTATVQKNPRVNELNVYDDAGNRRRRTITYQNIGQGMIFPWLVYEYAADPVLKVQVWSLKKRGRVKPSHRTAAPTSPKAAFFKLPQACNSSAGPIFDRPIFDLFPFATRTPRWRAPHSHSSFARRRRRIPPFVLTPASSSGKDSQPHDTQSYGGNPQERRRTRCA